MKLNRRHFLIGTGSLVATAAIMPKLILPERTLVANAQGIIVEMKKPELFYPDNTLYSTEHDPYWVLPYVKVKWPLGKVIRAFAGHEEIKWDQRRMSFQFNSIEGVMEVWNMRIQDPVYDEFVIPNFVGLVRSV